MLSPPAAVYFPIRLSSTHPSYSWDDALCSPLKKSWEIPGTDTLIYFTGEEETGKSSPRDNAACASLCCHVLKTQSSYKDFYCIWCWVIVLSHTAPHSQYILEFTNLIIITLGRMSAIGKTKRSRSVSLDNGGTTGITGRRRRVIETEAERQWIDRHSLDGERQCCIKFSSPADVCFSWPSWLDQKVRKSTYLYSCCFGARMCCRLTSLGYKDANDRPFW